MSTIINTALSKIPREPWHTIQKNFIKRLSKMTMEEQEKLQKELIKALYGK